MVGARTVDERASAEDGPKLVVLKPLVWNGDGYRGPANSRSTGGFVAKYGYGHEEWNGLADREWNGFRVFHTELKGRMKPFGLAGRLGMVMTAYKPGTGPVALGVATSVRLNTDTEMARIAKSLKLEREGERIWSLTSVRQRLRSRAAFDRHWKDEHRWVRWRAPADQYVWFDSPIAIDPEGVFPSGDPARPRKDIVKRHGSYMAVRPDQALAIIGRRLGYDHAVRDWLSNGEFDTSCLNPKVRKAKPPQGDVSGASAGAAKTQHTRYLEAHELAITPRHHELQEKFRRFIAPRCHELQENRAGVDLQYHCPERDLVLVEVKPCEPETARLAIRTALGQLLDYRQGRETSPKLLIVLETSPAQELDVLLALQNGVGVAWPSRSGFRFRWPERFNAPV